MLNTRHYCEQHTLSVKWTIDQLDNLKELDNDQICYLTLTNFADKCEPSPCFVIQ